MRLNPARFDLIWIINEPFGTLQFIYRSELVTSQEMIYKRLMRAYLAH